MNQVELAFPDTQDLKSAYHATFTSDSGKVVLAHLMKIGNILSPTAHVANPCMTYLEEGKRQIVLSILRQVHKDDSAILAAIEARSAE